MERLLAFLLGSFFMLSALGKTWDMAGFTRSIAAYGFPQLQALAPVVVALEAGMGAGLLVRWQLPRLAVTSAVVLAAFSGLFAYAHWVRGINACGCLGAFELVPLPPWATFGRNALLLAVAVWLYWRTSRDQPVHSRPRLLVVLAGSVGIFILAGFTYARRYHVAPTALRGQRVAETLLAPYVPTGQDSTYLVFIFSPSCTHCRAVTPTVSSYKRGGVIDRVIGISPETKKNDLPAYRRQVSPAFAIRTTSRDTLYSLTDQVPLALVIQRGSVTQVLGPRMPSADSLRLLLRRPYLEAPTHNSGAY